MAYYEMIFGSGTAWCNRYIIKTEYPTTDYGALVDAFIDYAREKGYSYLDLLETEEETETEEITNTVEEINFND